MNKITHTSYKLTRHTERDNTGTGETDMSAPYRSCDKISSAIAIY